MRRFIHGLLGLSLLLTACGDDDGDDGDDLSAVTSVPDETTSSTTTTTEAPTVAPDVIPQDESQITEEYVEQVLNELYGVANAALISTMEAGLVEERGVALVEATATTEHSRSTLNSLAELAAAQFEGIVDRPTGLQAEVLSVLEVGANCIAAEISVDRSGITGETGGEPDGGRGFVELEAATQTQRASGHNPTAWVIAGFPATNDGSVPDLACGD